MISTTIRRRLAHRLYKVARKVDPAPQLAFTVKAPTTDVRDAIVAAVNADLGAQVFVARRYW